MFRGVSGGTNVRGGARSQTWRVGRTARRVLCGAVVVVFVGYFFWPHIVHSALHVYHYWDCSNSDSRAYLDQLCANYSKGLVSGSLCEPLCTTKEIKFTSCLGAHLLKLYVFKAEWKGKPLVIKSIRPYSHHQHRVQLLNSFKMLGYDPRNSPLPQSTNIDPNMKLSREQFIVQANATLFHSIFGRKYTDRTKRVLGQVVSECDLRGDGILGSEEIRHCWRIIETEEYMLASLLDGHPALFEVYGLCGEFYAEQFATPLDSTDYIGAEGFLVPKRPWNFRAEVAIALLDMLEELEDTPYGGLHYCDVKEANFGLAKTSGRLVAKLIDLDSGWLGEENGGVKFQLKTYNNTCAVDDDCRFIHCHSRCNSTSHTCSGRMAFNNFHVLCQRILYEKMPAKDHWKPYLLQDPPHSINKALRRLLAACQAAEGQPQELLSELRSLLRRSTD